MRWRRHIAGDTHARNWTVSPVVLAILQLPLRASKVIARRQELWCCSILQTQSNAPIGRSLAPLE